LTQIGVNKFNRQCALEMEGFALGIDRYLNVMRKIQNDAEKDNTILTPEQRLMNGYISTAALMLKKKIIKKQKGNKLFHEIKSFYKNYDPTRLVFITIRYCLNCDPKNNALVGLCVGLGKHIEKDYEYLKLQEIAPGYLTEVERNLRSSHIKHRQKVLDHVINKVKYEDENGEVIQGIRHLNWSDEKRFHYGKFLIECLTEVKPKFFNITHQTKMKRISNAKYGFAGQAKFLVFEKTDELIDLLHKAHGELCIMAPLVYPFIVVPKEWTSAYGGGFHTQYKSLRTKILRTRNKKAIKIASVHGIDDILSTLNIIQKTKWRINKRVLKVMDDCNNIGKGYGGLPVWEDEDIEIDGKFPLKEQVKDHWKDDDFAELKKAKDEEVLEWLAVKAIAHDMFNRARSKRESLLWKLRVANKFKDEPELYFTWNCDYRGRIYCYQPYINPQMDDSGKALIEFAEGKTLGKHGLKHLCIHGANVFGFDKAPLEDRVQWVKDHEMEILNSADNSIDGMGFWMDADKPFNFLAFCYEYADFRRNPDSFKSHLPVQQDGTCSGLQHYSALLRDSIGGKVVNLTAALEKADVYGEVAKIVNEMLMDDILKGGTNAQLAKAWKDIGVDRKICKRNVMTFCYGATRTGFTSQLIEHVLKEGLKFSGKVKTFKACNYLGGLNWLAIEKTLVKSVEAMEFLQKTAFLMGKANLDLCWNSQIDLRVNQDYMKTESKQMDTYWGSVRIRPRFAHNKPKEKNAVGSRNGIAPNFIHSMDASHLMLTALKCYEKGITAFSFIHDSFGTHAGDMETMSQILRETFNEMYSEDLLAKFVDDIRTQIPPELGEDFEKIVTEYKPEMGSLDVKCVLASPYFFS